MATGNPWFTAVEQTLPEYIPLPMQQLVAAGQAVQGRYDSAMDSIDKTGTGLGSIEALAPAHRAYRDNLVNSYRGEISTLLDKYNSNATDPQFLREIKRVNSKYASDPNISTILMGNESIKNKQKAIQDIYTKGGRYIDTNPNFTGVDANGRLSYDSGQVRQTTFEKGLNDLFETASKGIIDDGNRATNKQALDNVMTNVIAGLDTNPVTMEALQYYAQQGYSQEEALGALQNDLQRLYGSYYTDKKVDTNERLALARQSNSISAMNAQTSRLRFNLENRKYEDELAQQAFANKLLPQTSPIEAKNANESIIKEVNNVLRLYDENGKIKQKTFQVPDTPENRAKYPNFKYSRSGSAGIGAPGQANIEVTYSDYQNQNKELIQAAREVVDPSNKKNLSDKQILDSYSAFLQNDNNAPTFWNTPLKENRDNIVRNYIGDKGENLGDAVMIDKNGKSKRVADGDIDMSEYTSFDFGGITSSPINSIESGAMKVTAINKKGELVMFMKPLDPTLQSLTSLSNLVSKATISGKTNTQLRNDSEYLRQVGDNTIIAPQRNVSGGIEFYQIIDGKAVGKPIDPTPYVESENARVGQFFGSFKNK